MKRPLCVLLPLLFCLMGLCAQADVAALDMNSPAPAPGEQYYLSDTQYQDPTLSVQVYPGGRIYDTGYLYAVITITQPGQLRTAMAFRYNSVKAVPGQMIAQANRAVLAVNGDDGYPCASAAVFGARLGSARDNWTEQLTNTASQACPLAALLLA